MKERERRVRRLSVRHADQFDNVLGERPLRQKHPCCTTLYFHPKKMRACPEVRRGEQTSQTLLHILDSGAIAEDQYTLYIYQQIDLRTACDDIEGVVRHGPTEPQPFETLCQKHVPELWRLTESVQGLPQLDDRIGCLIYSRDCR